VKCKECGNEKGLFGCEDCHPLRTSTNENLGCIAIIVLIFIGAGIYWFLFG
jgi:hypothetical protein